MMRLTNCIFVLQKSHIFVRFLLAGPVQGFPELKVVYPLIEKTYT